MFSITMPTYQLHSSPSWLEIMFPNLEKQKKLIPWEKPYVMALTNVSLWKFNFNIWSDIFKQVRLLATKKFEKAYTMPSFNNHLNLRIKAFLMVDEVQFPWNYHKKQSRLKNYTNANKHKENLYMTEWYILGH